MLPREVNRRVGACLRRCKLTSGAVQERGEILSESEAVGVREALADGEASFDPLQGAAGEAETMSGPAASALANRSGRVPGTNSRLRRGWIVCVIGSRLALARRALPPPAICPNPADPSRPTGGVIAPEGLRQADLGDEKPFSVRKS
jgi:hypothetical protein